MSNEKAGFTWTSMLFFGKCNEYFRKFTIFTKMKRRKNKKQKRGEELIFGGVLLSEELTLEGVIGRLHSEVLGLPLLLQLLEPLGPATLLLEHVVRDDGRLQRRWQHPAAVHRSR